MSSGRYAWMADALCAQADPDTWTDTDGSGTTAKRICGRCPVQPDCDAHSQQIHAYDGSAPTGIWGGAGRQQRHTARQQAA
jgi:WhiB family redox-sensing transcriptional regulator